MQNPKKLPKPAESVHITPELIDSLRDYALDAEKSGDILKAQTLMSLAKSFRPWGPLIIKKVDEYKKAVSEGFLIPQSHNRLKLYCNIENRAEESIVFFHDNDLTSITVEFLLNGKFNKCNILPDSFLLYSRLTGHFKDRYLGAIDYLNYLINSRINNDDFFWYFLSISNFCFGDKIKVELAFGDGVHKDSRILCYDSDKYFCSTFLIPDDKYYRNRGFANLRRRVAQLALDEWSNKEPKAFWRGSTSGGRMLNVENIIKLPRYSLSLLSKNNCSILDAKITNVAQATDEQAKVQIVEKLIEERLFGDNVKFDEFAKYKYLVEIDGNVSPWSFLEKLMMGSCVLRVDSDRKQWYYDQLEKWVHYVPVKQDMSDLIEKIQWCKDNDDKAREIAENGQRFADSLSFDSQMNFAAEQLLSAARVVNK